MYMWGIDDNMRNSVVNIQTNQKIVTQYSIFHVKQQQGQVALLNAHS